MDCLIPNFIQRYLYHIDNNNCKKYIYPCFWGKEIKTVYDIIQSLESQEKYGNVHQPLMSLCDLSGLVWCQGTVESRRAGVCRCTVPGPSPAPRPQTTTLASCSAETFRVTTRVDTMCRSDSSRARPAVSSRPVVYVYNLHYNQEYLYYSIQESSISLRQQLPPTVIQFLFIVMHDYD